MFHGVEAERVQGSLLLFQLCVPRQDGDSVILGESRDPKVFDVGEHN